MAGDKFYGYRVYGGGKIKRRWRSSYEDLGESGKAKLRQLYGLVPGKTVLVAYGHRYLLRDVCSAGEFKDDVPVVTAWKLKKNGRCYVDSCTLKDWRVVE